jgi:hypothetical protein
MGDKRRLIDAEALKFALSNLVASGGHKYYRKGMDDTLHYHMPRIIDELPVIDAVEVVHCAQCMYLFRNEETQKLSCGIHGHTLMELTDQSFCSAGITEAQWIALHGDELEDGDPLKPK